MKVGEETSKSWFTINLGGKFAVGASYFNIKKTKYIVHLNWKRTVITRHLHTRVFEHLGISLMTGKPSSNPPMSLLFLWLC